MNTITMKRLDEVKADIARLNNHDELGRYPCGCRINGNIQGLCDHHFVMLNT